MRAGQVVFSLESVAGQPQTTTTRYLAAGTYTLRYAHRTTAAPVVPVRFDLFLLKLSEGVGPYATRTTSASSDGGAGGTPYSYEPTESGSGSDSGYSYTGSSSSSQPGGYYYF